MMKDKLFSVFIKSGKDFLLIIGERILAPALAFFSVIGYTISALLFILSGYVRDAASLKEEADLTL